MNTTADHSTTTRLAEPQSPNPSRVPRWVEDPGEIGRLLMQAAGQRLMLAVGGQGGPRSALLLGADPGSRQLIIDPPFPALEQVLEPAMLLSISTRLDGAVMEFNAPFEDRAELGGEEALLLGWPQRLRYLQRRGAPRLGIPLELHVPPVMIRARDGYYAATLVDLSRQGAGAVVPRSTRTSEGDPVSCTIRVGDVEFTATAQVRSCIASLDRLRLGLQFGEIPPPIAARLSAAVARLERISLRKAADRRTRS